ncbi:MAG: recombination protein NinB [Cetobacterium sp.]|uniref:recombination protein NinB n=1 Tax=Cetobacterium sp. TaxID=2071632 RepID=UPI003F2FB1F7
MEKKQKFFIVNDQVKSNCLRAVQSIQHGQDKHMVVEIRESNRNDMQNRKFHAMCGDIAKQCKYMSRDLSPEQWKVLFVSGHTIATGGGADVIPGIEGEFCNIREKTSTMSVKRMASLIEYVQAWAANNGVRFTERDTGGFYG